MKDSPTRSRVLQLAHPPIPIVRIGIIGDQCKNLRDFHFMHIT